MSAWELEIQVGLFFSFSAAFSGTLTQRQMLRCFSPAWELDTPGPWRVSGFISLSPTSKTPPHHTWSCGDKHSRSVWYHQSWESLKYHQQFLGDCSERKALNTSKPNHSLQDQDPNAFTLAIPTQQTAPVLTGAGPGTTQPGLSLAQHPPPPSD